MGVPDATPRAVRVVRAVALVGAILWLVNGVVAIPARCLVASALNPTNANVDPLRVGWGPDGFLVYLDRMTAVSALGLPVGLAALLLSRRRAGDRAGPGALLTSLWLQGLLWGGGMVLFTASWGAVCRWFRPKPEEGLPPRIIVGALQWSGYALSALIVLAIIVACAAATRAVLRSDNGDGHAEDDGDYKPLGECEARRRR